MARQTEELPIAQNSGSREILDDIYLIQECNPKPALQELYTETRPDWYVQGQEVHMKQNAYLITGAEKTLLWDTTSPANKDGVLEEVERVLDGRDLDYLVPSHPEAPHAGNSFALLDSHPEAEFIVPDYETSHDLYMMEDATKVTPGDELDLGGYTFEIVEPVFVDHKVHMWAREQTTNTLFTVDWLGMVHMDTECLKCVDELEQPVTVHRMAEFHSRALFWLEYANVAAIDAAIDRTLSEYDPDVIAPGHGCPVREEPERYMNLMKDVVRHISDAGKTTEAW